MENIKEVTNVKFSCKLENSKPYYLKKCNSNKTDIIKLFIFMAVIITIYVVYGTQT